ncbi:tagaturonate reductase [Flagellimonas flava]|uniref:tagaturonate reductase n=1 Tax=Flagellimonas flava TaxID=570519 RepID=UPI003D64DF76
MKQLNRNTVSAPTYTERVLQFGEGNFLRAFANWMIHEMNKKSAFDAGVVVVQPIEQGLVHLLNQQDGLYTLYLNGIKNGKVLSEHDIIDCIQRSIDPYKDFEGYLANGENPDLRFIISNTTEAGISFDPNDQLEDTPQNSFPGKLTALLFKRFETFNGDAEKGLIVIPCELIDRNGDNLKRIIHKYAAQWELGSDFKTWIDDHCVFCNTLVDRIVPGYPKDRMETITQELGYTDNLVVDGEQFHLWVIEGPQFLENLIPSKESGLNIVFTDNMEPYRTRKVRILNGAHTSLVPVGYLYGIDHVRESEEDPVVGNFLQKVIFDCICPTLDLPQDEVQQFANDVLDRFRNPYLQHALLSISLNSISKFKTRVLPSLLEYIKRKQELPLPLLFSLASLIAFYKGERDGEPILLKDDPKILEFFKHQWASDNLENIVQNTLSKLEFWGQDLTQIEGVQETVSSYLKSIINNGMKDTLANFMHIQKPVKS